MRHFPRTPELLERCHRELERRKGVEQDKAVKKYGEDGLLPTGNPELDTLDYQINEMVGILRYAEMNIARLRLLQGTRPELSKACAEGVTGLRDLASDMEAHALALIGVRERLLDKGLYLGRAEVFK